MTNPLDEFVAVHLPADKRTWCESYRGKRKILHDSVWGTIVLSDLEVCLIDTPLMQRLRRIKQTGAASILYPSATHTRFEHSIGVCDRAGRMLSSLKANGDEGLIEGIEANVRIAALLHDTGHGPYSHTTEQFYSSDEYFEQYRQMYPGSGAGEILSCLIITSNPMRDFMTICNDVFGKRLDIDVISGIVSGTLSGQSRYQSEIVHGPMDADKIDYMHRDSLFTGLEMNIDIDRLFYSIKVTSSDGIRRLSGEMSSINPLNQIAFNKMQLTGSVYHHHKTRAVDCMIWSLYQRIRDNGEEFWGRHLESPVDFLYLDDADIVKPYPYSSEDVQNVQIQLRDRRLYCRALVIGHSTLEESCYQNDGSDGKGELADFLSRLSGHEEVAMNRKRYLASQIWEESGKPCSQYDVHLDVPKPPSVGEAANLWIRTPGEDKPRNLKEVMPLEGWVEQYTTHRARSFVFCPREHQAKIGAAAISVLQKEFNLRFKPHALNLIN